MSKNQENNDASVEGAENAPEAAGNTEEAAAKDAPANQVPVRELQKERRERQRLEQQIADLQKQQEEARQAELSEVEKLREQLNQTKQEADNALAAKTLAEQQSIVRTVASKVGFNDVNDAITFVNFETLKGLEGEELSQAIADEVQRVSEEKPYLLTASDTGNKRSVGKASDREGADQPPASGSDELGGFVHSLLFGKK